MTCYSEPHAVTGRKSKKESTTLHKAVNLISDAYLLGGDLIMHLLHVGSQSGALCLCCPRCCEKLLQLQLRCSIQLRSNVEVFAGERKRTGPSQLLAFAA